VAIEFGPDPQRLTVKLAEDTAFRQYVRIPLTAADGTPLDPWQPGVPIELRFIRISEEPVVWAASIDPNNTRRCGWDVSKADTAPVLEMVRAGQIKAVRWFSGDDYLGHGVVKDVT
jgi:hypothetical protein